MRDSASPVNRCSRPERSRVAGLRSLAEEIARDREIWTEDVLRERLANLGVYVYGDDLLGEFALLMNRLRFALERSKLAETFTHYTLSAEQMKEIENRIHRMKSANLEIFRRAQTEVGRQIDLILEKFRGTNESTILGYDADALPASSDGFLAFVNRVFGEDGDGKLHYYFTANNRGVIDELTRRKDGTAAAANRVLGLVDLHRVNGNITERQLIHDLRGEGAMVVSNLGLFSPGVVREYPHGHIILYPGRHFDETQVGLDMLARKVDDVAKIISQADAVTAESLLSQLADYGFAFRKAEDGGMFIFPDRAAFLKALERTFESMKQTAVMA